MGLSEEIKAEIESQLETFKKELKKELQSLFNQRTTDTINGVEEKYLIMSSGMTGALSAATIKFDNATKLISGVTVIDKLDQYGITVDNIHQILDTNRKAFSGFTQSATTLFKKLQEDVESGITFAVSSVSGIIRTNIESGLTSAITEANAQLFDQSKEFTNGVFANASAFTLSKFNEVSSNLGSLSGDVRGLASGFTGLNNQFVFYTPTSAMSGVVLNITNDKFVKQNDFGEYSAATESALTNINDQINGVNSKFDDFDNKFTNINSRFDDVDEQINDHGTNIVNLDTQLKSFSATFETNIEGFNNKFSTIEGNVGVLTNDFNGMNAGLTEVRDKFNLYTPTEDMNTDFILERVNINTIQEMGEFMTKNDIDYYIREAMQEVGNNYVSKNEFISFSGTVSNKIDKIYGVADGGDIVYP